MIVQASVQVVPVELAGFWNHRHLKNRDAALALECPPGIDVGVMIQLGDDDRVTRPKSTPQGSCQVERQRRSCWGRRQFPQALAFRKVASDLPRFQHGRVGLGTTRKRPVGVGVVV